MNTQRNNEIELPQGQQSLVQEFAHFIVQEKAWWMTPIVVVMGAMVAFIVFAESSPLLPYIYAGLL